MTDLSHRVGTHGNRWQLTTLLDRQRELSEEDFALYLGERLGLMRISLREPFLRRVEASLATGDRHLHRIPDSEWLAVVSPFLNRQSEEYLLLAGSVLTADMLVRIIKQVAIKQARGLVKNWRAWDGFDRRGC